MPAEKEEKSTDHRDRGTPPGKAYMGNEEKAVEPMVKGIELVAAEASWGVSVHPVKTREVATAEGMPSMWPPILLPSLCAATVSKVTIVLPAEKARISLK